MKQKSLPLVTVWNPVYKTYAHVLPAWTMPKAEKWLNSNNPSERVEVPVGADGACFTLGPPCGTAIWLRRWCGCARCVSILAHEALHLSLRMLYTRGVGIELPQGEALTYLHEFYMCAFLEKLSPRKPCS